MEIKVDLFSDTATRPSPEMREFMARAEVGDEQLLEDPSVNRLNQMVAELLGKEAAIYLPSGLMANQISFAVQCRPGDEIMMDQTAHPIHYEGGAAAVISGVLISPLTGKRGIFTAGQLKDAIRTRDYHHPQSRLVSIEQTSNLGGGTIWPLETIKEVCQVARENGLATHMDGARLLNAAVATGITARAGIYALENNLKRLSEDHQNARRFAEGIADLSQIELDPATVETNIVLFKVKNLSGEELANQLLSRGIRLSIMDETLLRAVTHLDVSRADVDYAVAAIRDFLE